MYTILYKIHNMPEHYSLPVTSGIKTAQLLWDTLATAGGYEMLSARP